MDNPRSTPVDAGRPNRSGGREDALTVQLPVLRAVLERQLRFRRDQLSQLDQRGEGLEPSFGAEPADARDATATLALREVNALVAAGARRALTDIELALERMRQGRYGRCRSCGIPIPLAVLEAVPKTTLCLKCQSRSTSRTQPADPRQERNAATGRG
jgi:DnaK suppressor protein